MSEEDLQELTFALTRTINQETELTARLPEELGNLGTKGDAVTIGQIILAAAGGGGALAALLPVLKAYIERTPKLRIVIEKADGRKITLEAEHLRTGQLEEITEAIKKLGDDA
jgi:hypothetical protein